MPTIGYFSKAEEIAALKEFAARMKERSHYLGAWLSEVMLKIEQDIRSNFVVSVPLPSECAKEAVAILENAKIEATALLAKTQRESEAKIKSAERKRDDILYKASSALHESLRLLDRATM